MISKEFRFPLCVLLVYGILLLVWTTKTDSLLMTMFVSQQAFHRRATNDFLGPCLLIARVRSQVQINNLSELSRPTSLWLIRADFLFLCHKR